MYINNGATYASVQVRDHERLLQVGPRNLGRVRPLLEDPQERRDGLQRTGNRPADIGVHHLDQRAEVDLWGRHLRSCVLNVDVGPAGEPVHEVGPPAYLDEVWIESWHVSCVLVRVRVR